MIIRDHDDAVEDEIDREGEAAAARLRGQLELFPNAPDHIHGVINLELKIGVLRDAVAAASLKSFPLLLNEKQAKKEPKSPPKLWISVEGQFVRFVTRDDNFTTWSTIKLKTPVAASEATRCIVERRPLYLLGTQMPSDEMVRLSLNFNKGEGKIFLKGQSIRISVENCIDDLSIPSPSYETRVHLPCDKVRSALLRAAAVNTVSAFSQTVEARDGSILAGADDIAISSEDPSFVGLDFAISTKDSARLRRIIGRLDPIKAYIAKTERGYVVSDGLIGCEMPQAGSTIPSVVPAMTTPALLSIKLAPTDLLWFDHVSKICKPDQLVLCIDDSETHKLHVRAERKSSPHAARLKFDFAVQNDGHLADWNATVSPRVWSCFYAFSQDATPTIDLTKRLLRVSYAEQELVSTVLVSSRTN